MIFCTLKALPKINAHGISNLVKPLLYGTSCKPTDDSCKKKPLLDPSCKVAAIAGGTGGIGFATAHQFLANDARLVALMGLDPKKGLDAVRDLNCAYGKDKAVFMKGDIRDKKQVEEMFANLKCEYKKIEIFVNAAGIWNDVEWQKEIAINLAGTINTSFAAQKYLNRDTGVVVNLAGVFGLQAVPPSPILAALQAAQIRFSQSLGHDMNFRRTGIRCVVLCPGVTHTDFNRDADKRTLTREEGRDLEDFLKKSHWQNPDVCAKSVIELVKYGNTGSIWVIEGSRLFQLNYPGWQQYSNLISQFT